MTPEQFEMFWRAYQAFKQTIGLRFNQGRILPFVFADDIERIIELKNAGYQPFRTEDREDWIWPFGWAWQTPDMQSTHETTAIAFEFMKAGQVHATPIEP